MKRSAKSRKISAVMAFVMSVSLLAAGCEKTSEDTGMPTTSFSTMVLYSPDRYSRTISLSLHI